MATLIRLLHGSHPHRRRGVAVTLGQSIRGAVGVAVPLFASRVDLIGDVCLTTPEQKFDDLDEADLRRQVIECAECARDISQLLGAPVQSETWPPKTERAVIEVQATAGSPDLAFAHSTTRSRF